MPGQCVQGWCLPPGPGCLRDSDCHATRPCVRYACEAGRCVAHPTDGACERDDDAPGTCQLGYCELAEAASCRLAPDAGPDGSAADAGADVEGSDAGPIGCPEPENPCRVATCAHDRCVQADKPDGEPCKTAVGGPGACQAGQCVLDEAIATTKQKKCRDVIRRSRYGAYRDRKCTSSLKYRLTPPELTKAREKIAKVIEKEVHYDVHVGLIALPEGGYNLQLTNRRDRRDIRGLVDPSFVAFALGGHTSRTDWKSRHLTVWLNGLTEGWTLSTRGSRKALRKGKSASRLGFLGVVDVSAFRKWLEVAFKPTTPQKPLPGVQVLDGAADFAEPATP